MKKGEKMKKDKKYSELMGKLKLKNYKKINIQVFSYKQKEKYFSIMKYCLIKIITFLRNKGIPIAKSQEFFRQFTNQIDYNVEEKIAVYTCIFGKYDEIIEPDVFPDNIDYYIITDLELPQNSHWKKIEPECLENMKTYTDVEKNRYFKMNPYEVFKEYHYSIYVDGNIKIVSDLSEYIKKLGNEGVALHKHRMRNCTYKEIEKCIEVKKGKEEALQQYKKRLLEKGMPEEYGLLEAGVIVRDNYNPLGQKVMQEWWDEFFKQSAKRDQISLPYILWKNQIKVEDVATLGENFHRNYSFRKNFHVVEK